VQIIAEDADVADAVHKIALSKAFDHATSCSSENSVIIHESLYDQALHLFETDEKKGYIVRGAERDQLEAWMWRPDKKGHIALNPEIVARGAVKIASDAGISVPEETKNPRGGGNPAAGGGPLGRREALSSPDGLSLHHV
jgi:sulfoacetaldehyde dehydrogenase